MRQFLLVCAVAACTASPLRAESSIVLPFFNLSKDRNLDWIGESAAETVHESLTSEGILMLNREDRMEAYTRLGIRPYNLLTRASIVKIGDELDASSVVYGSFQVTREVQENALVSKPSIRLTARLLDLRMLRQSAEFVETGLLEDLAALQNHISLQIVRAVFPARQVDEQEFLARRPKIRIDALETYVRGLLAKDPSVKHRYFTQAARIDPSFSQPAFQLGYLHWGKDEYRDAAEWFKKVAYTDAHYREAHFYLGLCRYYLGAFAEAEKSFRMVASVVPLNEVYCNLGASQLRQNNPQALENFEKALEGDPADPDFYFNVGYELWRRKRYDEAAERFRAVLDREPKDEDAILLLGYCIKRTSARQGDLRTEGLERVKEDYEETVFRQLKRMLEKKN